MIFSDFSAYEMLSAVDNSAGICGKCFRGNKRALNLRLLPQQHVEGQFVGPPSI